MQNWIRSGLMRCSRTIFTGAVLTLTTFFSLSSPMASDIHTTTVQAASVRRNRVSSRRIEIDLSEQRLRAWEGGKLVYTTRISTGKRSTPTPVGTYWINSKYRTHRMRGRGYDIPNVPYAMYFYRGYAIHGAFWHNRFGTPVSHGCVNLPVKQARRLYAWTSLGTPVVVKR
jgi:lipoprotein-anchoring transpeptidase ErfK/SrfK